MKAYWTEMALLHRNWPFMHSIARSDDSNESNDTNPNPLERPVSWSRWTDGVCVNPPKALKGAVRTR